MVEFTPEIKQAIREHGTLINYTRSDDNGETQVAYGYDGQL